MQLSSQADKFAVALRLEFSASRQISHLYVGANFKILCRR